MTYEETVDAILNIPKFTKKNAPSHTREFMERLGNPQEKFYVVHVAGSNGKGSVCAYLNSVLQESKVRVGMFTSPHLTDIRERFSIGGRPCSKEEFLSAEQKVRQAALVFQEEGRPHPTFFEYIFAVGMVLFAEAGIICAILETGLGGRLDATNVVRHPILTILTSISLEHTEILGDTIEKIAAEKAGILKKGVPVLFDGNEPLAEPVIRRAAEAKQAPVKKVSRENIKILLNDGKNIDFSLDCGYDDTTVKTRLAKDTVHQVPSEEYPVIRIHSVAEYQAMNAGLALTAIPFLREYFEIPKEAVLRGLENMHWPGRMEEVFPEVYLDGAHNVSGIQAFLDVAARIVCRPSILLFSIVREKDYEKVVRLLCEEGDWEKVILTRIGDTPRALEPTCLKDCFDRQLAAAGKRNTLVFTIEDSREAFAYAMQEKKQGQKLFCAGSLYLIGELKKITGGQKHD